ncbi:MAG: hypothetical protein WAU58_16840 [Terriglobales bacterium]
MFAKIMDTVFGCRHSRYSFPMTIRAGSRRAINGARTGTYVVCLDCGHEFGYDWQEMKIAGSQTNRPMAIATSQTQTRESARPLVTKEAA